jgi:hypothetical protein
MAQVNQEYIDEIKKLQSEMENIKSELGTISIIEHRKQKLLTAYVDTEESLRLMRAKIYEEYGLGTIDLSTGEFKPNEDESNK